MVLRYGPTRFLTQALKVDLDLLAAAEACHEHEPLVKFNLINCTFKVHNLKLI